MWNKPSSPLLISLPASLRPSSWSNLRPGPRPGLLLILLIGLWSAPIPAVAATGSPLDLYTGTAPVQDQGEAERRRATPAALLNVLQKLSGLREIPPQPALDAALENSGAWLLAFQYLEEERLDPGGEGGTDLLLAASFVPERVDGLVRELGLSRWRSQRSPVILWVVLDEGRGRQFQPDEYDYVWERARRVAARRGLPVAWPELSAELREQVDLQLIWGGYTEQLLTAGSSASGVATVAGRREGPEWNLRWTLADDQTLDNWRTRATDLSIAMEDGVELLADRVAALNSLGQAGQGAWRSELLISGLGSGADYARCLAYLDGLALVDRVELLELGPGGLRFALDLNAEPAYLERSLLDDRVLEPGESPGEYRLRP
jgi:hypothetical protein